MKANKKVKEKETEIDRLKNQNKKLQADLVAALKN